MQERELLIVGGGIAGALLAWQSHFRGITFKLIISPTMQATSDAASGQINHVVFKRFVK